MRMLYVIMCHCVQHWLARRDCTHPSSARVSTSMTNDDAGGVILIPLALRPTP